ncbi:hypothetical protein [Priestia taiwanensis]|uniref:Uncharacterized protein n=1 Tax=Priestia taiwanensis TaxID=1347902 RepID=A0A917ERN8_9BACI|nr:hypothetical protein [Priestia taiwanensis]MBM7364926.1 putative membrane protein YkvI [Priestia taiwanensis]GGE82519.1 hypothetical protein GCM10007140_35160 [Priestia taiwanensis]
MFIRNTGQMIISLLTSLAFIILSFTYSGTHSFTEAVITLGAWISALNIVMLASVTMLYRTFGKSASQS